MKKIAAILMFLCFLPPYMELMVAEYQIDKIRSGAEERLKKADKNEELVWLRFAKKDVDRLLKWEHSREFEYKGDMYDIAEITETRDSIFYRCHLDRKETKYKNILKEYASEKKERSVPLRDSNKRLGYFFSSMFLPAKNFLNLNLNASDAEHSSFYLNNYTSVILLQESPPPQAI